MPNIIAYFSRSGENYIGGKIVNLTKGNTEIVAETISSLLKTDIYKIEPLIKYSGDYSECLEEAKSDQRRNARPVLKKSIPDLSEYDTVFLGYPNFWGTIPMPVFTFLENADFSDKRILPFCTHEGSGVGKSINDIKILCPNAKISEPLLIHGEAVPYCKTEVDKWLRKNLSGSDSNG